MAQMGDGVTAGGLEFRKESWRGAPGFFRVARTAGGQWWIVSPDETPMLWRGVNDLGRGRRDEAYAQMVGARFGGEDLPSFADDVWRRLVGWGFNALGAGATAELHDEGRPHVVTVGFMDGAGPVIRLGGAHLPDVFDRDWPARCRQRAGEVCVGRERDRALLGYLTDEALNWAQAVGEAGRERPSLLQICLSLEPGMAAYHASWEFVLAPYGGELAAMAAAWGVELSGRPAVRQWTQEDRILDTPGYRRDDERFAREFARRYYSETSAAIRERDGNHLILGARFAVSPGAAVWQEATAFTDLLWLPMAERRGVNGVNPATGDAPPMIVDGFSWHRMPAQRDKADPELSELESMLREGRSALTGLLQDPACCGYTWAAWRAGNAWAVPPWPAGLVFDDDRPVLAHVEPLRSINGRAETTRIARG